MSIWGTAFEIMTVNLLIVSYMHIFREIRGFAIKICTTEGTWDLVGNNIPVFFIDDPIKFPSLIHSQGPNPVTNVKVISYFFYTLEKKKS